jgi:hypothetical protein
MFRIMIVLLAVYLAFGLSGTALAQTPGEGVITGQVINGTEGGGSVEGVEVTLLDYIDDTLAETRTASTDAEGKFSFSNIAIGHTYYVSARYMDVDYYYPVELESGKTTAYIEVGVCDTTDSDQSIRTGLFHTIIEVEKEYILVTEVFWLTNDSDRTYTETDKVLVFSLPEGAYSFSAPQELMQDYKLLSDSEISYMVPFPPGERQLVFAYELPGIEPAGTTIPLKIDYPTDIFHLMLGGEVFEVSVSDLTPVEPVYTEDGERYIHYQAENLTRGTVLEISLNSLSGNRFVPVVVVCVIIAVLISGGVVYLLRRRKVGKSNE